MIPSINKGDGSHGKLHHAERNAINTLHSRLNVYETNAGIPNVLYPSDDPKTDRYEDIQTRINLVQGVGGSITLMPGKYRLSHPIKIKRESVVLQGIGGLHPTGYGSSAVLLPDTGITAVEISNSVTNPQVVIRDLAIYGGKIGIHFKPSVAQTLWSSFKRLTFKEQTDTAMLVQNPMYWSLFEQVRFAAQGTNGLIFDTPNVGNHCNQFTQCSWNGLDVGLIAHDLYFSHFLSCHWEAVDYPINIDRSNNLQFFNSYFEHNGDPVTGEHTQDVVIGETTRCFNITFYDTYCGPHRRQPDGSEHVWLKVATEGNAPNLRLVGHNEYDTAVDWGDGTVTAGQGTRTLDSGNYTFVKDNNSFYMRDSVTGTLRKAIIANGELVIT